MTYARIQNDTVVEILQPVIGFSINECFHPSIIAMCELVDDSVQSGWVRQEDGSFAEPLVEEPVVEEPVVEEPVVEEPVVEEPVVEETPPAE